jgi:dihydroflavonol-4-reductase
MSPGAPTPVRERSIAVTGASGFLGRYLVRALLAEGARVVAVVRNPAKVPALAAHTEVRAADLADPAALARAFEGCDAVFANAGVIGIGDRGRAELIRANLDGTRNVMRAAHAAGARRVVMTSSASAYRPQPGHHYREDHPLRDEHDRTTRFGWYATSKGAAERAAWELADRLGLALSTARPHAIFGAFDDTGITAWLKRVMRPPVSFWVKGMNFPSVYAGDLANAMVRMLELPAAAGRAYNLAGDPDAHGFWPLYQAWRAAGGPSPRIVVPVPFPMRRSFDLTAARRDLGFTTRSLVDGMRETLALEAAADL